MKTLIAAVAAMTIALPAAASSQLALGVARELPRLGFEVNVDTLSNSQVAALHSILHSRSFSHSEKLRQVKSVLGGEHALRGLFKTR